ncbi:MAG TPA: hypothetical protein VHT50_21605 [Mycobacterium sp.]|nr:hypothetical protein [Mycobacterium sp.]
MDTELRYEGWFKPFSVPFGLAPQQSDVSITNDSLHVSMGWGFRADIPLSSITDAKPSDDRVYSWGVHGWRGRCPPVKGRVLGVPVTLKTLWVSVTDPDALIVACRPTGV